MKIATNIIGALLLMLIYQNTAGQIAIVKNSKPLSRIVIDSKVDADRNAANLMNFIIQRITGTKLPIVDANQKLKTGDIVIGDFQCITPTIDKSKINNDGFFLSADNRNVRIAGKGQGTVYGVVTLLEDYFGIRFYAKDALTVPQSTNMTIPVINGKITNPRFRYRQTQGYSLNDSLFKTWHRLNEPHEVFAGNYWVHTFDAILPSATYGKSHPEYYALINGERRPGWASQWCLTNPDVFEIVSHKVDSIFKANPGKSIISISQNDGHDTYCTCENCTRINNHEGSLSGSIIWFLNKLAARFPDKEFSTLAYMYSVTPPKHIKPLPNVNIMLCNIECSREVTLQENEEGKKFVDSMEKWAKITDNIFVWDYGIDFDNYLSPFPNFHVMQPNIELFGKNKTTMHFSQIAGSKGGDFSEMRTYIAAKLMWNPDIDTDSLINEFLNGYYGEKAAPYLYRYIKLREGALMGSGLKLNLYDTPVSHKNGMLNNSLISRYSYLFDKAEEASRNYPTFYKRVKECRLPVLYSELETAHTCFPIDTAKLRTKLTHFRQQAKELNVSILNEQNKLIEDYCYQYERRYLSGRRHNLATNAKITFITTPDYPFNNNPETRLTDGILGADAPGIDWLGWQKKNGEFIIDLGRNTDINEIEFDFLQRLGSWALLPKKVKWSVSTDGISFKTASEREIEEDRDRKAKFVTIKTQSPVEGRYIKVEIETIGLCPDWHLAVGHPAWFLIDEIFVY